MKETNAQRIEEQAAGAYAVQFLSEHSEDIQKVVQEVIGRSKAWKKHKPVNPVTGKKRRRSFWTAEEDARLKAAYEVATNHMAGKTQWKSVAKAVGNGRSNQACRDRLRTLKIIKK